MTQDCPKGWKTSTKIGNLTLEDQTVEICGGICNFPDLCGISDCEYYDIIREGTVKFQKALAHEDTLEGMREKLRNKKDEDKVMLQFSRKY